MQYFYNYVQYFYERNIASMSNTFKHNVDEPIPGLYSVSSIQCMMNLESCHENF